MQQRRSTLEEYQKQINIIVEYINNHLDESIETSILAEISGFSPWHFHRIMRAFLGEPIGAYIIRKRLETAARLLRYSDMPIQEIACRIGYNVPSSLSKLFRQFYQISPNEYRNNKNFVIMKPVQFNPEIKLESPQIKVIAPRQAIYIRLSGSYMNNDYSDAFQRLWAYVRDQQLFSENMDHLCIYHNDPKITEADKLQTDVCLTISKPAIPKGEIGVKTIDGGRYAIFRYQGPYSNLGMVYDTIYGQWLPNSGYTLSTGSRFEKYLNNPSDTAPENLLTEIYLMLE